MDRSVGLRFYLDVWRGASMNKEPFERLTERQRRYLRRVMEHRTSNEIAFEENVTSRSVDRQLELASKILGVHSRVEAARRFAEYEAQVERFPVENGMIPASPSGAVRLPWPLPSKARPINTLRPGQIMAWGAIIAIVSPVGITVAAMAIVAIGLLLGMHFG
jgi:DNA-binding CsgD family transcriptional regulator